jgi:hypothetical protein
MEKILSCDELACVTGGGAWDAVDNGISKAVPNWQDKSCHSRSQWVGWGVGTGLGAAQWATWPYLGPAGQAVLGPVNGLIGTYAVSSYIENCERQKAGRAA